MTTDFAHRCKTAQQCLPPSEYRDRLEALHSEMLAAIGAAADHVPAAGKMVEATADECIKVSAALEQNRALQIVEDVRSVAGIGSGDPLPTAFATGYRLACDEIEHRL